MEVDSRALSRIVYQGKEKWIMHWAEEFSCVTARVKNKKKRCLIDRCDINGKRFKNDNYMLCNDMDIDN